MTDRIPDLSQGIPEDLKRISTLRDEPSSYLYQPPEGAVLMEPPKEGIYYRSDPPNPQTDKLQAYERRYIIPVALMVSSIFKVSPITGDIYRKIPEHHRLRNLFCIISRSGIKKLDYGLAWDSVVVTVRSFCVVRVQTLLDPQQDRFAIQRLLLWSSRGQRYETVTDPETGVVNARVLPYILEQYNQIEGIVRR
jgi:hypothetical protein